MAPPPFVVLLATVLALAATAPVCAQTTPPVANPPMADQPTDGTPAQGGRSGSMPEPGTAPGGGGGERGSRGVIAPPADIDPGIHRAPPPVEFPSRVIPPPGSPGGDTNVKPK
jgi:hypothetical protein